MANFNDFVAKGTKRHGKINGDPPNYKTYQDLPNDDGNWSSGKAGRGTLIGTNRSIAAPTLISWRGKMVTKSDMQALTAIEATAIYKAKYWDDVRADEIKSQTIANFFVDMKSSAGTGALKAMQKALVKRGENMNIDGIIGTQTITAINRQIDKNAKGLYQEFHNQMTAHYNNLNPAFRTQWLRSMNKYYPYEMTDMGIESEASNKALVWSVVGGGVVIIVGLIVYFLQMNPNK